ncbi:hypothetical protein [Vitiosangium sp. GDMCC 1.1324]|uniref:hypothetical protein n=1 Tax=Vitiosangium sp. (strain GDMCC 1.1324) TaxID=2138576 RepID=UPI000D3D0F42|nr:hypothetical protein [Vitiosangium sp. GDMCC 1.1324]PTL85040.1 hypothetical protein DAT35_08350 [Vitiosangium sp. GDMCC 1.1324]
MDDKKNGASGEELEQLGPYQLKEQVPQSPGSQGELYRATHEESGATALVLKPAEEDKVPQKDWRVHLSASASEKYVAMVVEQTPWSVAADRQSVESLLCTLEEVHESVRRMTDALAEPEEPRPLWRQGLGLASAAAAVFAVLFALVRLVSGFPPPSGSGPLADTPPVLTSDDAQVAGGTPGDDLGSGFLADALDGGEPMVVARPLPREPLKGQKRPPCTRYVEVEINGACWAAHELKAPCPDALYEYQGKCYLAAYSAKPPPQSLEP